MKQDEKDMIISEIERIILVLKQDKPSEEYYRNVAITQLQVLMARIRSMYCWT